VNALSGRPFIGLLDIFGFEDFGLNSLEQLLINYSNEHLQAIFNEIIFSAAQQEAAAEGVPPPVFDSEAVSNASTLALFATPHKGLFSLLDEECIFPKGSDLSFAAKLAAANADNAHLGAVAPSHGAPQGSSFSVAHYAGRVTYASAGFLQKNKDPFSEDLLVLLRHSNEPFVAALFTPVQGGGGSGGGGGGGGGGRHARAGRGGFKGVVAKYASELDDLLRVVASSRAHFVRCIKPNTRKAAACFEHEVVLRQLRCGGVLEAVRVFSSGYPDRIPISEFVSTYRAVVPPDAMPHAPSTERAACAAILSALGIADNASALGKTKLFLAAGILAHCRSKRDAKLAACVVSCQAGARGLLARRGTREARNIQAAKARDEARAREILELARQQAVEMAAARAAAEARQDLLREKEERARRAEEAEVAAAAARALEQKAAWGLRETELAKTNASLAAESGRKAAELMKQLEMLTAALRGAEEKNGSLEQLLSQERAAVAAQDAELRAGVSRWRDEAGLASQRERQAVAMAEARLAHAEEKWGEARDEASFFKARFQELALSFAKGAEAASKNSTSRNSASRSSASTPFKNTSTLLDGISNWAGSLLHVGGSTTPRAKPRSPASLLTPRSRPRGRHSTHTPPGAAAGGRSPFSSSLVEDEAGWSPTLRTPKAAGSGNSIGISGCASAATAAYASYLGLDPVRDASLLWIAEAAATEPLPEGWAESRDPEGRAYYHSAVTGEASRQHPRDAEFRQLVMKTKLETRHSARKAEPSAGAWSTIQMKSVEQSLCSSASAPVRAIVRRASPPDGVSGSSFPGTGEVLYECIIYYLVLGYIRSPLLQNAVPRPTTVGITSGGSY